jgi:hypothetical protein
MLPAKTYLQAYAASARDGAAHEREGLARLAETDLADAWPSQCWIVRGRARRGLMGRDGGGLRMTGERGAEGALGASQAAAAAGRASMSACCGSSGWGGVSEGGRRKFIG